MKRVVIAICAVVAIMLGAAPSRAASCLFRDPDTRAYASRHCRFFPCGAGTEWVVVVKKLGNFYAAHRLPSRRAALAYTKVWEHFDNISWPRFCSGCVPRNQYKYLAPERTCERETRLAAAKNFAKAADSSLKTIQYVLRQAYGMSHGKDRSPVISALLAMQQARSRVDAMSRDYVAFYDQPAQFVMNALSEEAVDLDAQRRGLQALVAANRSSRWGALLAAAGDIDMSGSGQFFPAARQMCLREVGTTGGAATSGKECRAAESFGSAAQSKALRRDMKLALARWAKAQRTASVGPAERVHLTQESTGRSIEVPAEQRKRTHTKPKPEPRHHSTSTWCGGRICASRVTE